MFHPEYAVFTSDVGFTVVSSRLSRSWEVYRCRSFFVFVTTCDGTSTGAVAGGARILFDEENLLSMPLHFCDA